MLALALLLQFSFAFSDDDLVNKRLAEVFPAEAVKILNSRRTCIHFAGEEPYDEQRRKEIEENVKKHCRDFKDVSASLEKKYKGKAWLKEFPKVWKALDEGDNYEEFIWNVPEGKSKVLSEYCERQADLHLAKLEVLPRELKNLTKGSDKYKLKHEELRNSWDEVGRLLTRQKFISPTKYAELEKVVKDETVSQLIAEPARPSP